MKSVDSPEPCRLAPAGSFLTMNKLSGILGKCKKMMM